MIGDNDAMEVTPDERQALAEALMALESVDPADLPEPAAHLAELLSDLLDPPAQEDS